ncbi:efflux RND transporter periplasmic adaptor subunit [Robertkochia aurantiaca]|uniref:efflux RND transporter periplasmic adaptor subunit n=1 Tax=Robertkochia aurantiaca TaxID=2873700 RepID=UPI001CCF6246|nr:efflux RND transporter periplasmic adaptor subunit [Robertkochia sp. 3YJGBD-33]
MTTKKTILISVGILAAAAITVLTIFLTEPEAQREGATKQTAMLVDVIRAEHGDFYPVIRATGTVSPVEDVLLSPLVGGQVIRRSPAFIPGGYVKKGELLLQIDPSDYRNTLELRKSDLMQAQTQLKVEMGRQQVAEQDLQLIGGDTLSDEERALVLRQPQLEAVKATIKAAGASVQQAELDLQRTRVTAPFDAHILTQNVTLGSQIAPGDNLGRLVGTDYYWVTVNIPVSKLRWLIFPDDRNEQGSPVRIRNTSAWGEQASRKGYIDKQVGALDNQTRLASVLVRVPDPLAKEPENEGQPRVMIGSFVEVDMEGEKVKNVIRIDRSLIRTNQTVWVMKEGKLDIRDVEIALTDAEHAYIRSGIEKDESIVTTNLSTVTDGIALRTADDAISNETAKK